jgi:hypothetical protein
VAITVSPHELHCQFSGTKRKNNAPNTKGYQ